MPLAEKLRQEGEQMGLEKGKLEGKIEIAKAMLQDGDPVEKIVRITGLSSSQIQDLV